MIIREFRESDYDQVIRVWKEAGLTLKASDERAELLKKMERDPDLFLVAQAGNQVVGAVIGAWDGRRGWVYHLAVHPAAQMTGIGRTLLTEVETRLRNRGALKVNLLVQRSNLKVMEFYQRLGYQADDAVLLGKSLRSPLFSDGPTCSQVPHHEGFSCTRHGSYNGQQSKPQRCMTMDVYKRIEELGWTLPPVPRAAGNYLPAKLWGNTLYVSGQTPKVGDEVTVVGKVGAGVTVEQAYEGARIAVLNCLAQAAAVVGDLNRVEAVLKLMVYVHSAPGFGEQPKVGNGASDALVAIFGEAGRHARTAIGMAELPSGAAVEVDLILGVKA